MGILLNAAFYNEIVDAKYRHNIALQAIVPSIENG